MRILRKRLLFEGFVILVLTVILIYRFNDRNTLIDQVKSVLPDEEGSMLVSMLWGESQGIGFGLYRQMKEVGLVHILVVSGSNMMIVVKGLVELLASWLGRKKAIMFGLGCGWWYATMTGWQIPVIRAVIMVSFLYLSQIVGRKGSWLEGVIFAGLIMLVADYRVLGNVSFWLSFLSFAAVSQNPNEGVFKTTLRVSLWLTPILAFKFGVISLLAPFSNFMVLFLIETVTVVGFGATLLGSKVLLWLLFPFLSYIRWIVGVLSNLDWFQLDLTFNIWMLAGSYLLGLGWYLRRRNA